MRTNIICFIWKGVFALVLILNSPAQAAIDPRGGQFIWFHNFSAFEKSRGERSLESVLTSPVIAAAVSWDQLVPSWNADMPESTYLRIEARAVYPSGPTKYFTLGRWAMSPSRHPRESVPEQKDDHGDVATDTLILSRPADRLQVRITLGADDNRKAHLKFLGLSLADTRTQPAALTHNALAWDKVLPVPERSQMSYPNGKVLCSPTTLSMLLSYWSRQLARPDLEHDVPEVAAAVYDSKWQGTGNWPFNTAYAGSFRGMRAYVTRMTDLSELEDWIAAGIPVGLSVCYDRLRGKGPGPNGHLVVLAGFTAQGDPIINDPGTSRDVRKVFPRKNLTYAWAYSHNAAYLVYPEDSEIPKDRFGHWASWTARQRVRFER